LTLAAVTSTPYATPYSVSSTGSNYYPSYCTGANAAVEISSPYSELRVVWSDLISGSVLQTDYATAASTYSAIRTTGTQDYNVQVTDVSGCVANYSVAFFGSGPTASLTASNNSICGTSGSVTLDASGSTGATNYTWDDLSHGTTDNVTATTTTIYGVTVTDGNSCSSIASTTVTVTPYPSVSPITGLSTVCAGSNITLADATSGGAWTSGSTGVATISSGGVVTGVAAGTSSISYEVTAGSCATTVTKNVTVLPVVTPTVAITVNGTSAASHACQVYGEALVAIPGPGYNAGVSTFNWFDNGSHLYGPITSTSVGLGPRSVGSHVFTCVMGNLQCANASTATSAGTTLTVDPYVTPVLTVSNTTPCNNATITALVNGQSITSNSLFYQWYYTYGGGGPTSLGSFYLTNTLDLTGRGLPTGAVIYFNLFVGNGSGNAVCMTSNTTFGPSNNATVTGAGCSMKTDNSTGIEVTEAGNINAIEISPNPSSKEVSVSYNMIPIPNQAAINLYDMMGKLLLEIPVSDQSGHLNLDVSKFPTGIYIVALENNHQRISISRLAKD
jgi:hypothetical protein